jgi:GxxExxY protein
MKSEGLTHAVIGAAMDVHSALGPGFLESIYKNALFHELRLRGISAKPELEVEVTYKDLIVGRHRLDLFVEDEVVVELKAIGGFAEIHIAQALSYMKATQVEVGLIINFGEDSLYWKRLVRKSRAPIGI